MDFSLLHVLLVVFFATLIRSTFGFGEALVAVPLLALRIPVSVATPLAVLLSITVAGVVVVQDWRHVHVHSAGWLVLASLFGIPLGLLLLKTGAEPIVKIALAIIVIAFAVFSLFGHHRLMLHHDSRRWLLGCGFLAGVLGGAYGINSPPLIVYGAMRRWSAQHFRATLQGYFLPASALGMMGYWLAGLWTMAVTRYYLLSLPGALLAIFLGRAINHRLRGNGFLKYVYVGLIATGAVLLVQAMGFRV